MFCYKRQGNCVVCNKFAMWYGWLGCRTWNGGFWEFCSSTLESSLSFCVSNVRLGVRVRVLGFKLSSPIIRGLILSRCPFHWYDLGTTLSMIHNRILYHILDRFFLHFQPIQVPTYSPFSIIEIKRVGWFGFL